MSTERAILIVLVAVVALAPAATLADGGIDPGEVWLPDGTIQWENLTFTGLVTEPIDGIALLPEAVFEQYLTPSGDIVLVPSPITLMAMYAYPDQFGALQGGYGIQNLVGAGYGQLLHQILGGAAAEVDSAEFMDYMSSYENEADFYRDLLSFQGPAWTLSLYTTWQIVKHMVNQWSEHGYLLYAWAILLYDSSTCETLPGGCPDDWEPPEVYGCADPTIEQGPPVLSVAPAAPPYPLVIGQDPDRRGADVQASVSIPPVIFTWYELVPVYESRCREARTGEQGQCKTSPQKTYLNGVWETVHVRDDCRQHVEVYPEPVADVVVWARLTTASTEWIQDTLAQRYYGAHTKRPQLSLVPQLGAWLGGCSGGTCTASAFIAGVPFEDPGTFELLLRVETGGTPVTRPRSLFERGELQVYLARVTLGEADGP